MKWVEFKKNICFVKFLGDQSRFVVVKDTVVEVYSLTALMHRNRLDLLLYWTEKVSVVDILPNPDPDSLYIMVIHEGGDAVMRMLTPESSRNTPIALKVSEGVSACWSRKGKQIVIGSKDGFLRQFTPQGQLKNTIAPPVSLSGAFSVLSIAWMETSVFVVCYVALESLEPADGEDPVHEYAWFIVRQQGKGGPWIYNRLADPCPPFGFRSRLPFASFTFCKQPFTDTIDSLIIVASSPSTDIGTIFKQVEKHEYITVQPEEETKRAIIPLATLGDDDAVPLGIALDPTFSDDVRWPTIWILSSDGVIVGFNLMDSTNDKCLCLETAEPLRPSSSASQPVISSVMLSDSTKESKPTSSFSFGSLSGVGTSPLGSSLTTSFAQQVIGKSTDVNSGELLKPSGLSFTTSETTKTADQAKINIFASKIASPKTTAASPRLLRTTKPTLSKEPSLKKGDERSVSFRLYISKRIHARRLFQLVVQRNLRRHHPIPLYRFLGLMPPSQFKAFTSRSKRM